jgi:hypothetical protein
MFEWRGDPRRVATLPPRGDDPLEVSPVALGKRHLHRVAQGMPNVPWRHAIVKGTRGRSVAQIGEDELLGEGTRVRGTEHGIKQGPEIAEQHLPAGADQPATGPTLGSEQLGDGVGDPRNR